MRRLAQLLFTFIAALTLSSLFSTSNIVQAQVSANGKIVFASTLPGNREIYTVDANGSLTRLTFSPGADLDPAWSPNGTKIAFRSQRDGNAEDLRHECRRQQSDPAHK